VELTPQQNKAISEPFVNMPLIACAGSGKTEVIARRVVKMHDPKGPDKLLPVNIREKNETAERYVDAIV
jgi:ATP-dependent exoDNAse (exonuclease V) beta subunit